MERENVGLSVRGRYTSLLWRMRWAQSPFYDGNYRYLLIYDTFSSLSTCNFYCIFQSFKKMSIILKEVICSASIILPNDILLRIFCSPESCGCYTVLAIVQYRAKQAHKPILLLNYWRSEPVFNTLCGIAEMQGLVIHTSNLKNKSNVWAISWCSWLLYGLVKNVLVAGGKQGYVVKVERINKKKWPSGKNSTVIPTDKCILLGNTFCLQHRRRNDDSWLW